VVLRRSRELWWKTAISRTLSTSPSSKRTRLNANRGMLYWQISSDYAFAILKIVPRVADHGGRRIQSCVSLIQRFQEVLFGIPANIFAVQRQLR
jgi:hypothetical protein